jgi:multiple antibiotic resistance protein
MRFLHTLFFAYLALFPILNPPAMAPVFFRMTEGVTVAQRNHLAFLIGLYTFLFLSLLLCVGGWLLKLLGISIPVIAIAGGLLLFHSAWKMLNDAPRVPDSTPEEAPGTMLDQAFYPLTLPVTAGPGAIAVTLSLVPSGSVLDPGTLTAFLATACGIALAGATVFLFYRYSTTVIRKLGKTGAATITQISAFVLLAIGVQIVWGGLQGLLKAVP